MALELDDPPLTIEDVVAVARDNEPVRITDAALARVRDSRQALEARMAEGDVIYGVNTGVGSLADTRISRDDAAQLQANLIRSNAFGVGDPITEPEARATMVLRLASLLAGHSGVRPRLVTALADALNQRIHPYIPRKGSAGASGDLAPLAHMALVLVGESQATTTGTNGWRPAGEVLDAAGLTPVTLREKEGLALINGTAYTTGLATLSVHDARQLLDAADLAGAMTLEAHRGIRDALDPELHQLRGHPGAQTTAARIHDATRESTLVQDAETAGRPHDQYSLRCMPQVHGACRDVIDAMATIIERELNAVTDNPVLLADGTVVSGGNFHAEPVALAVDTITTALAEIASLAERRLFALVAGEDDNAPDALPPFLVGGDRPGLNCGFMIPQVAAAALVSENKTLAHPASVDSIPTLDNQEDHVSMGATGANHLITVVENVTTVLAIEVFAAYQALTIRNGKPGARVQAVLDRIAEDVDPVTQDRAMTDDLEHVRRLVANGAIM